MKNLTKTMMNTKDFLARIQIILDHQSPGPTRDNRQKVLSDLRGMFEYLENPDLTLPDLIDIIIDKPYPNVDFHYKLMRFIINYCIISPDWNYLGSVEPIDQEMLIVETPKPDNETEANSRPMPQTLETPIIPPIKEIRDSDFEDIHHREMARLAEIRENIKIEPSAIDKEAFKEITDYLEGFYQPGRTLKDATKELIDWLYDDNYPNVKFNWGDLCLFMGQFII